jgi:hypothetical protein
MARLAVIGVALLSTLLIWKSGALDSVIPQNNQPKPLDPGPVIAQSGEAMSKLQSLHLSLDGTLVLGGVGVQMTGSGDLTYPHNEKLSLQLRVPGAYGQPDTLVSVNERIEKGRTYVQQKNGTWKDVTNDQKGQVAPGLDPMSNLGFVNAFRASDDLGDLTMDGIQMHHFSLTVDSAKYVAQLKADPNAGLTAADEAELENAGIQVEIWISATDLYVHQMKLSMTTSDFTYNVTYRYSDFVKGGGSSSV